MNKLEIELETNQEEQEGKKSEDLLIKNVIPTPRVLEDIVSKFKKGQIDLQPDFQREFVWNTKKQKELIQSLIEGIPLPLFYTVRCPNGTTEIIDGQQRLTTILWVLSDRKVRKLLFKNRLQKKLIKLQKLKYRFNNTFIKLNEIKRIITTRNIYWAEFDCNDLKGKRKYDIFRRLNQGASQLKPQEIRHSILRADTPILFNYVKQFSRQIEKLLKKTMFRYGAEELAIRFIAITKMGYDGRITIINNSDKLKKEFEDIKFLKHTSKKFKGFCEVCARFFGVNSFQLLKKGIKYPKTRDWNKYTFSDVINQALFHLMVFYFSKFEKRHFQKLKTDKVRAGFLHLLKNDKFTNFLMVGSNIPRNVKKAKSIFEKEFLYKYLGEYGYKENRNISKQESKTLLKNVPFCYLCYGKLKSLRNVEPDHIKPYKEGEESAIDTELLTHKKCNRKKSGMKIEKFRRTKYSIKMRLRNIKNISDFIIHLHDWVKNYPKLKKILRLAKKDSKYAL